MRRSLISALVLGSLVAVGCNPEPAKKNKVPTFTRDDDPMSEPTNGDDQLDDVTTDESPTTPVDEDPSTTPDDPEPDPKPEVDPNAPKKTQCTAQKEGNTSTSEVTYVVQNGKVSIKSLVVTVKNKNHRNKNDVDVYLTPSGGQEQHQFNSGDIVKDLTPTTIPLPSNFGTTSGSRLRIETNFDDSFGDPHESCFVQF